VGSWARQDPVEKNLSPVRFQTQDCLASSLVTILTEPPLLQFKGAHTRTSLARESASGSLNREPGSDIYTYTGCLQKNGAISKINKKFISHLTGAKRTPSAAATVQVFL
jgi:hypothetical protein